VHGLLYCTQKGLYGRETWVVNKSDENEISVFEIKVLGRIYGPTKVSGEWRLRYNHEFTDYIIFPKSFKKLKLRQLGGWDAYLEQMNSTLAANNMCKSIWYKEGITNPCEMGGWCRRRP